MQAYETIFISPVDLPTNRLDDLLEKLKAIILGALTKRASEAINEEIEFMPPVRLSEVENAQEQIIDQLRKLETNGEIVLNRQGDKKNAVV